MLEHCQQTPLHHHCIQVGHDHLAQDAGVAKLDCPLSQELPPLLTVSYLVRIVQEQLVDSDAEHAGVEGCGRDSQQGHEGSGHVPEQQAAVLLVEAAAA